ncbi:unnamed protein product [Lepeophtheirus salmonis]|uniref:(salmon louse) hypothetical protein n=1 Tax=Lepeophtheirus salmonis TaxID=72036 RepID=A0A7R8HCX7_LEPSM|nr:unnamed protein product [Lepeophtheirus salmonis]CAF3015432.1 unnamed protein product [Lepeophtheirus salmonis]
MTPHRHGKQFLQWATNLSIISRKKSTNPNDALTKDDIIVVREIGGTMVQLWPSFIEPINTRGILYVIDASEPESLGKATIHLLEFLNHPNLNENVEVLIVFSKTDIKCSRSLSEFKFIMRLNHIIASSKRYISHLQFNAESQENQDKILEWCFKFSNFC